MLHHAKALTSNCLKPTTKQSKTKNYHISHYSLTVLHNTKYITILHCVAWNHAKTSYVFVSKQIVNTSLRTNKHQYETSPD